MSPSSEHYLSCSQLVERAERILVVTREHPTNDSIGSLIALGLVLESIGKEVTLLAHGRVSSTLSFLAGHDKIQQSVNERGQFVIMLDTSHSKVADLSYDFSENGKLLRICITPDGGEFGTEHVRCDMKDTSFDLIMVLDTPDFESLGASYQAMKDLFVSIPVVNVDHHRSNALFGEVNIVDDHATSTAEVLAPLLESFGEECMTRDVSTALLAGIVDGTRSFQREATSSRAFTIAAQLVARGADQQRVVRSLFKNRSLSGMKLWGRLFARVAFDESTRIAWTTSSWEDLKEAGADKTDLVGIDDEISMSLPGVGRAVVFFQDQDDSVSARITCLEGDPLVVSRAFGVMSQGPLIVISQNGVSFEEFQEAVLKTLQAIPFEAVVSGESVA